MLSKHDFHVSLGRTARFGGHFSQHPFTTGCGNISYSICLQLAGSLKVKHLTSVPAGGVCPLDWTGIDKQACLACCLVPNLTWTRTLKQNLKADVLKKKKKTDTRDYIYCLIIQSSNTGRTIHGGGVQGEGGGSDGGPEAGFWVMLCCVLISVVT